MSSEECGTEGCTAAPVLSIVFINYNTTDLLNEALESLSAGRPSFPVEIVIVDNASSEDWRRQLAEPAFPVQLIANRDNLGYAAAANQGIARARGEYVAIANTDIRFLPGSVELLVRFLQEHPEAGVVSPQLFWPDMTPQSPARHYPSLRYLLAGRRSPLTRLLPARRSAREFMYAGIDQSPEPVAVEAVFGTFLVAPRSLLQELGGFDEHYTFYVEDVDLCRRANAMGRKAFVLPQARVIHYMGAARHRRGMPAEFLRLRGFYRYFRQAYPRLPASLFLVLFGGWLAVASGLGTLGLQESDARAGHKGT